MGLEDKTTLVSWRNESPQVVEAIQKLLTDGTAIDVRVRLGYSGVGVLNFILLATDAPDE